MGVSVFAERSGICVCWTAFCAEWAKKEPIKVRTDTFNGSRSRSIIGTWTFLGCEWVMNWRLWINLVRTLLVDTFNNFRNLYYEKKLNSTFQGFYEFIEILWRELPNATHNPTVTLVTVPLNKHGDKSNPICYRTSQRTLRTKCVHLRGPPNVSFLTVSFSLRGQYRNTYAANLLRNKHANRAINPAEVGFPFGKCALRKSLSILRVVDVH